MTPWRGLWPPSVVSRAPMAMLRSSRLLMTVARGLWPMTTLRGLWPEAMAPRCLWQMIALRGLWLVSLRGPWPVLTMKTRALDPSPEVRGPGAVLLVKTPAQWGLWPKLLPQTTRPKTRRPDRPCLHKAGLPALPGREWWRNP